MPKAELERRFDEALAQLECAGADETKVREVFQRVLGLAEQGYVEAAALLGEMQALERPVLDPEAAYRWYYIDARASGSFTTTYQNQSGTSDHYVGPPGDFRNEPLVADMIELFGVGKIPGLDREAENWLARHL